jgi:hypothetical protein
MYLFYQSKDEVKLDWRPYSISKVGSVLASVGLDFISISSKTEEGVLARENYM